MIGRTIMQFKVGLDGHCFHAPEALQACMLHCRGLRAPVESWIELLASIGYKDFSEHHWDHLKGEDDLNVDDCAAKIVNECVVEGQDKAMTNPTGNPGAVCFFTAGRRCKIEIMRRNEKTSLLLTIQKADAPLAVKMLAALYQHDVEGVLQKLQEAIDTALTLRIVKDPA